MSRDPADHYHAIIIGGGLGGLVAGANLSRHGKRVLLIEQHGVVGGCATAFKRKEYSVEASLHMIDGLDALDSKRPILEELGVFESVEFVRVPELYRFVDPKTDIVIPASAEEARAVLVSRFPAEARGIDAFFARLAGIGMELARLPQAKWKQTVLFPLFPLLYPNLVAGAKGTLGGLLDRIITDEELKLALTANVFYYHDDPYTLSLLYFALAQGSYYRGGGHFVKGGSQRLSDHLATVITRNGGTVLTGHEVTRILVENGRATGVRFRNKRGGEETQATARAVIANASVPSVVNDLLPQGAAPARFAEKVNRLRPAMSLLSLYLGFKTPPKQLGNRCYSTFVYDSVRNVREIGLKNHAAFEERPFVFVDYGQIDSGLAPAGKSLGVVTTPDYLSDWDALAPEDYKARKERVARILIGRLERLVPGIFDAIEYYEVATPKTLLRFTRNPHGTPYGFAQTPEQSGMKRIGARSPLPSLYFASAWSFPGHGYTGTIVGGYLAAQAVLASAD